MATRLPNDARHLNEILLSLQLSGSHVSRNTSHSHSNTLADIQAMLNGDQLLDELNRRIRNLGNGFSGNTSLRGTWESFRVPQQTASNSQSSNWRSLLANSQQPREAIDDVFSSASIQIPGLESRQRRAEQPQQQPIDDGTSLWKQTLGYQSGHQLPLDSNTNDLPSPTPQLIGAGVDSWKPAPSFQQESVQLRSQRAPVTRSQMLQKLMAIGFQKEAAQAALINNNMDVSLALSDLIKSQNIPVGNPQTALLPQYTSDIISLGQPSQGTARSMQQSLNIHRTNNENAVIDKLLRATISAAQSHDPRESVLPLDQGSKAWNNKGFPPPGFALSQTHSSGAPTLGRPSLRDIPCTESVGHLNRANSRVVSQVQEAQSGSGSSQLADDATGVSPVDSNYSSETTDSGMGSFVSAASGIPAAESADHTLVSSSFSDGDGDCDTTILGLVESSSSETVNPRGFSVSMCSAGGGGFTEPKVNTVSYANADSVERSASFPREFSLFGFFDASHAGKPANEVESILATAKSTDIPSNADLDSKVIRRPTSSSFSKSSSSNSPVMGDSRPGSSARCDQVVGETITCIKSFGDDISTTIDSHGLFVPFHCLTGAKPAESCHRYESILQSEQRSPGWNNVTGLDFSGSRGVGSSAFYLNGTPEQVTAWPVENNAQQPRRVSESSALSEPSSLGLAIREFVPGQKWSSMKSELEAQQSVESYQPETEYGLELNNEQKSYYWCNQTLGNIHGSAWSDGIEAGWSSHFEPSDSCWANGFSAHPWSLGEEQQ